MTTTDTTAMHLVFDLPPEVRPLPRTRRTLTTRVRTTGLIAAATLGAGLCFLTEVAR